MMNNMVLTFEQVDGKLLMTIELVKPEHPNPTMIRSNDGNTETIEFVNPPLTINTNQCGLDLSKYKPFPMGYIVTAGKKVIFIEHAALVAKGTIGVVKTWYGHLATVVTDNGIEITVKSHKLAPLDPSDHPDYKPEKPEPRPMNADEIVTWLKGQVDLALRQPHLVAEINLSDKINALVQYELNKAKR